MFFKFCPVYIILLLTISCVNYKKAVYFNEIPDSRIKSLVSNLEPIIQKNDLLSISIGSLNPQASVVFNTPNSANVTSSTSTGNNSSAQGYLVDQDGFIQFPVLGNIKAEGLTKKELKTTITKSLNDKELLVDPVVTIRYLNFKVTVLGEVQHPTIVNVPNEKITLLEALGLAGDVTIYGKRDNIMIIREENEDKVVKRINLNSGELFMSPYYYLKANDIVYVQPNKARVAGSGRANQLLPIILSGLSFIAIVVDRSTR